jgi:hypothetical protein
MCLKEECYLVEVGYGFNTNSGERGFSRGSYIPYRTINNFIKSRSGYSVFSSAYRYSSEQVDKSDLYGDLYLDFDDANDFEHVRKDALTALSYLKIVYHIDENQVHIYFSGNKGVHITVPAKIFGFEPMPLLNGVFKTIALSVKSFTPNKTVDTQIYDNKRMFRIPNTIHEKSNLYKIPITPTELRNLSETDIRAMAVQPRAIQFKEVVETNHIAEQQFQKAIEEFYILDKESKKDRRFKSRYNFTPPCIQYLLTNGASEGQRNVSIACLTGFYKNSGKSLSETIDLISEWNSNNVKPTGEQEMKKTIKSIFNGEKIFGCSTLKLISVCNESQCKLSKKKEGQSNVNSSESNKNQT